MIPVTVIRDHSRRFSTHDPYHGYQGAHRDSAHSHGPCQDDQGIHSHRLAHSLGPCQDDQGTYSHRFSTHDCVLMIRRDSHRFSTHGSCHNDQERQSQILPSLTHNPCHTDQERQSTFTHNLCHNDQERQSLIQHTWFLS